jgi:hypothetical protein
MRLVADLSAFQTQNWAWTARQPYDLDSFAGAVDAAWVRWADWSGYVRWGADPDYAHVIGTLRDQHLKPVGGYLYPRPSMSDPVTQVAAWHAATPPTTWAPMLDPEDSGGLSGPDLSRWIDTALAETAQRFQRIPWLYTQASKVQAWGLTRPTTPHLLILAWYPFGTTTFPWAQRAGWEQQTLNVGRPDIPPGWDHWDAWQFTDRAEVPGFPGLMDCSWVTEDAFAQSASGVEDGFTDMEKDVLRGLGVAI